MKRRFLALLLAAVLLWGCSGQSAPESTGSESQLPQEGTTGDTPVPTGKNENTQTEVYTDAINTTGLFTDRDRDASYNESKSAKISLQGAKVSCSTNAVRVSGSTVTITDEGTYVLSGKLDNGIIIVDADKEDKVQLVLAGVTIHNETSAAIYVRQADKVFLTLQEESVNTLSNGGSFVAIDENNIDAVVFSKDDITLNGVGSLVINAPTGHGIVSKDEITVTGGNYSIAAASHGLSGEDSVCIADAAMVISAGKDGIKADHEDAARGFVYIAEGSFTIEAEGDGISASSTMQIDGGSFLLNTGGGSVRAQQKVESWGGFGGGMGGRPGPGNSTAATTEDDTSTKAIKTSGDLAINGGSFVIDAADDAVHAKGNMTIGGGDITLSSGDDAFHADSKLTIAAGTIHISESYEGLEGLCIEIAGGNISLVADNDGLNAAGGNGEDRPGGFRGGDVFAADADGYIAISGGTLFVDAAGDGIDSNGDLIVSGGHTVVEGPTNGANGPLDYAGKASISGGTLMITGSVQMAQSIGADGQGVLSVAVGNQAGGTKIELVDSEGTVLITVQPSKAFSCVVISCPGMVSGDIYTLKVGALSGQLQAS